MLTKYTNPPSNIQELKNRVKHLIRQGWSKSHIAIDKDGKSVLPSSDAVSAVCLAGAICRASNISIYIIHKSYLFDSFYRLLNKLCIKCGFLGGTPEFNRSPKTTLEQAMDLIDSVPE